MISNDSILFEASTVLDLIPSLGDKGCEEHIISYLPLSHIAGQMVDVFAPLIITAKLSGSCCLHFADSNALKGKGNIYSYLSFISYSFLSLFLISFIHFISCRFIR